MYKSYLIHNNAYDCVVITFRGETIAAGQVDADIFREFHSPEPDWDNWSFGYPYQLEPDDNINSYGEIYASRTDNREIEIVDPCLYERRQEFWAE